MCLHCLLISTHFPPPHISHSGPCLDFFPIVFYVTSFCSLSLSFLWSVSSVTWLCSARLLLAEKGFSLEMSCASFNDCLFHLVFSPVRADNEYYRNLYIHLSTHLTAGLFFSSHCVSAFISPSGIKNVFAIVKTPRRPMNSIYLHRIFWWFIYPFIHQPFTWWFIWLDHCTTGTMLHLYRKTVLLLCPPGGHGWILSF